ncbi:MAG TPA: SRPBCC family protein [Mycobacteriales bacterium]|jgi:uncharacterized protein YndB with AHSA1/START domain|nr:SRPBCC family protein [Mycobacteriales bacterium]
MLGRLDEHEGRWRLRFSRRLPAPPERVWRSLTEPAELRGWFPAEIEGERAAGAPLRFVFPDDEGPALRGEMTVYDPPAVLGFRWQDDQLRFELTADGDGTALEFVNTFTELGTGARTAAGWHACLDLLEHELADSEPPWKPAAHWEELHARYVEALGPEASAIGPPGT